MSVAKPSATPKTATKSPGTQTKPKSTEAAGQVSPSGAVLAAFNSLLDGIRRAIVTHDLVLSGLPTCGPLLDWSWRDLTRLEFAQYDVLGTEDRTRFVTARVAFTVGGFAADGSRATIVSGL